MREHIARLRWRIIAALGGPTQRDLASLSIKAQALDELRPALTRAEQLFLSAHGPACSSAIAVNGVCDLVEATFRFAHVFAPDGRCSCGAWRQ